MTSLDDINPGDYIVQVWTWRPKVGKATQTLKALEEAKEIFESHGSVSYTHLTLPTKRIV